MVDYSTSYFIPGYFNFHVNRRVGNRASELQDESFKFLFVHAIEVNVTG